MCDIRKMLMNSKETNCDCADVSFCFHHLEGNLHMIPTYISRQRALLALAIASMLVTSVASADTPATPAKETRDQLTRRIESIDRALFDAFNRCELEKLESYFSPELEFYHDNDGLSASRAKFISDVKKNVCGKFRRELIPGTLEVWPLGEYGAVYSGTHRFCQFAASKCEGTGRFLHILSNSGGEWRITRVVSYDHRSNSN